MRLSIWGHTHDSEVKTTILRPDANYAGDEDDRKLGRNQIRIARESPLMSNDAERPVKATSYFSSPGPSWQTAATGRTLSARVSDRVPFRPPPDSDGGGGASRKRYLSRKFSIQSPYPPPLCQPFSNSSIKVKALNLRTRRETTAIQPRSASVCVCVYEDEREREFSQRPFRVCLPLSYPPRDSDGMKRVHTGNTRRRGSEEPYVAGGFRTAASHHRGWL